MKMKHLIKPIIISFFIVGSFTILAFFSIEGARTYGNLALILVGILLSLEAWCFANMFFYGSYFINPIKKFKEVFMRKV